MLRRPARLLAGEEIVVLLLEFVLRAKKNPVKTVRKNLRVRAQAVAAVDTAEIEAPPGKKKSHNFATTRLLVLGGLHPKVLEFIAPHRELLRVVENGMSAPLRAESGQSGMASAFADS